jgi:multidrug efflux pump subunit AcrA (membrane-fusion protein)
MKNQIKYSEEFTDTIKQFPNFNSTLFYSLLFIISIIIFLLSIIKSPEIINGEAIVTAIKSPIEITSQISGRIVLKEFKPKKFLKKNQILAVIENYANEEDVFKLKEELLKYNNNILELNSEMFYFAFNLKLGEIEESFLNFQNNLYLLDKEKKVNEYDKKRDVLKNQNSYYYKMIEKRESIIKLKNNELIILKNKFIEDSLLFTKGLILKTEYEQSTRTLLKEIENLKNYNIREIENRYNISDNQENINLLNHQEKSNYSDLEMKLINSYIQLTQSINLWESKYVLKVPFDGVVDMMQFISSYQTIKQGDPIFSVSPNDNKVLAQLIVPPRSVGKIKIGQQVVIKLESFPYQEFGKLIGNVSSISLIPTQNYYLIIVELPKGLKSDSNQTLSFSKNMIGSAEIITSKRSLLYKLFDKIITAFDKEKEDKKENNNQQH